MKDISFFMAMIPPTVTDQEHKVAMVKGKPVFYRPEELKTARSKLIGHLAEHTPPVPMSGPLRLIVKWLFPKGTRHKDGEYKATRPDTDNLQKMLKDCMTECHFWIDDAQVASEITEKFFAAVPGIYIRVEEIC